MARHYTVSQAQLVEPFVSIRANPMTDALCPEGRDTEAGTRFPRVQNSLLGWWKAEAYREAGGSMVCILLTALVTAMLAQAGQPAVPREFGSEQFDEVVRLVRHDCPAPYYDESRAYGAAANAALALLDPAVEVVGTPRFSRRDLGRVLVLATGGEIPGVSGVPASDVWYAATKGFLSALDCPARIEPRPPANAGSEATADQPAGGIGVVLERRLVANSVPQKSPGRLVASIKEDNALELRIASEKATQRTAVLVDVVTPGSPADVSGMRARDRIVSVDGKSVDGLGFDQVVSLVRGERGTSVSVVVVRGDPPEEHELRMSRKPLLPAPQERCGYVARLGPCIGVVQMRWFFPYPEYELPATVSRLSSECSAVGEDLAGLVLDLRDGGFGLFSLAVRISTLFLARDRIALLKPLRAKYRESAYGDTGESYRGTGKMEITVPVVLVTNRATDFAAEVFAAALQDAGRGLIVGERTAGDGAVQVLRPVDSPPGYFLRTTDSWVQRPSGATTRASNCLASGPRSPSMDD